MCTGMEFTMVIVGIKISDVQTLLDILNTKYTTIPLFQLPNNECKFRTPTHVQIVILYQFFLFWMVTFKVSDIQIQITIKLGSTKSKEKYLKAKNFLNVLTPILIFD